MKIYLLRRFLTICLSVFSLTFIAGMCDVKDPAPKPIALFSYYPATNLVAPVTISFTNMSENADSYQWTYGTGAPDTDKNIDLTFREGGTYTVTLKATGKGGTDTYSRTITVSNSAPTTQPTAGFTYSPSQNLVAPATVAFTNTSTNAISYKWDFGDGTISTLANPTKQFTKAGDFTVKLTATDAKNQSAQKSVTISVQAAATVQVLNNPNEISRVMIIPGSTLESGTPPAVTTTPGTPVITFPNQVVNGISGQDTYLTINYSGATEGITVIYVQLIGADSYFKIPLNQATGSSGTINIPIRIPEKYTIPTCAQLDAWAATSNYQITKCGRTTRRNCLSFDPLSDPGKGKANIGGQDYNATAVCDLDFGQFGRGYGIQMSNGGVIVLYNMKQGSNQLGNLENLIDNSPTGNITVPFAFYSDGSTAYWSVSGTATASGKKVSASGVFREVGGSRQISISASGNCQ